MSKIVWVNGCFDVLHVGHIELLKFANVLGDVIVGIDSDKKVKGTKGNDRPFNNQKDRKFMLESIKYVKGVVVFRSEQELEQTIRELKPDYMVIGSDWRGRFVVGRDYTKQLIFFEKVGDYSTTKILEGNK